MIKRTVFKDDIKKDGPYDYVLIDYKEAVDILKRNVRSGTLTTIQGVKENMQSPINNNEMNNRNNFNNYNGINNNNFNKY